MMKRVHIFFAFLALVCHARAQTQQVDSLKQLLLQSKEDTTTYNIFRLISWNSMWSYSDTALLYSQKTLLLARQLKDPSKESEAFLLCGTACWVSGNFPLAIDYLVKGIHIEEGLNKVRTNDVWNIPALQLLYYNTSECYIDLNDFEHAFYYYEKAVKVPYKSTDINLMESFWHLSRIYEKFNYLDSSLLYAKKAFDLDIKMHGRSERGPIPIALGNIFYKKKDYKQALTYYRIAENVPAITTFLKDAIEIYNGIASIYQQVNRGDSAVYYAQKALDLQALISYPVGALKTYGILSDIYKKQKQLDSAMKYMEQTSSLQSKLFNQNNEREIQTLSFNEKLHEQEVIAEQQQYRTKMKMYGALVIVAALLLVAIVLWRNIQHRKKAFALLQKQKQEIDRQKEKVESTLSELKSTQAQLIQSEKMASLGQLTAGIAHEIQNPLNFVNNFSEVNTELIEEAGQEMRKGNINEAELILNDIKENEQKINHHGKRAGDIVKGMLQHSHSNSGVKEPTDINKLADEYLRLSFQGLRAKDKTFNAIMQTHLDENISKVNIIPQEIGRVLLNLYNNAFYAVAEKKKQQQEGYEPIVSVTIKKINHQVEIIVEDNGNGIPQKMVDKIFQPFFTTKPTGQGTGLGLSLSYDIIKAHGGELKVETKENEGAAFIIFLPV